MRLNNIPNVNKDQEMQQHSYSIDEFLQEKPGDNEEQGKVDCSAEIRS